VIYICRYQAIKIAFRPSPSPLPAIIYIINNDRPPRASKNPPLSFAAASSSRARQRRSSDSTTERGTGPLDVQGKLGSSFLHRSTRQLPPHDCAVHPHAALTHPAQTLSLPPSLKTIDYPPIHRTNRITSTTLR